MYYPSSENKGADQLRGYREADLRLCFRLCRLLVFPRGGSNQSEERVKENWSNLNSSTSSSSSDSSDSSSASEVDNAMKKKKHKEHKTSGINAKASDRVKNPRHWPHAHLQYEFVNREVKCDDLDDDEMFIESEMEIISAEVLSDSEKKGRLNLLKKIVYYV